MLFLLIGFDGCLNLDLVDFQFKAYTQPLNLIIDVNHVD
jgi:hypothetical protein